MQGPRPVHAGERARLAQRAVGAARALLRITGPVAPATVGRDAGDAAASGEESAAITAFLIILPMLVLLAAGINKALAGSGLQGTKNKFAKLGTIAGRSKAELSPRSGPPSSTSGLPGGKTLLQWQHISQAGGYHIALRFNADGVCEGVTHEHSSKR